MHSDGQRTDMATVVWECPDNPARPHLCHFGRRISRSCDDQFVILRQNGAEDSVRVRGEVANAQTLDQIPNPDGSIQRSANE